MDEDFNYDNLDIKSTGESLYGDTTTKSEPVVEDVVIETAPETTTETDDDNPFVEEPVASEPVDEDDETFKKLELEEKWRTKRLNKEIEAKKIAEAESIRLKAEIEELKKNGNVKSEPEEKFDDARFKQTLIENDAEINALQSKVDKIKASKDSYETMGDYADALAEAQADLKIEIKDRKKEFLEYQKQTFNNQNTEVNKILDNFNSKVEALKEDNPMIIKAKELIENRADELHVDIRRAFLTDEYAGELTWIIGSSKKNLDFLVQATKIANQTGQSPIEALKMIGKWSTDVERSKGEPTKQPAKPIGVPKVIKNKPAINNDDMDPYEYASKLLSGKIKNTLY